MLHLIYNPVAGRGRAPAALRRTRAFLAAERVDFRVHTTLAPRHATELVARLPQGATVVAMGGDGTVHEVARSCIGTPRPMGVLPVGSGDDFAFALGLRRSDFDGALRALLNGRRRLVDTGSINGEPFVNAAGVGFDADVASRVAAAPAPLRGLPAYLFAVVGALAGLSPARVTAEVDDVVVYHGRSLLVSTQNGPRTGGSFLFAPSASPDDGVLDLVLAGELGRVATLRLLPRVMRGKHLTHPKVHLARGRRIALTWERAQPGHVDGEPLEPASNHTLSVVPASLCVLG